MCNIEMFVQVNIIQKKAGKKKAGSKATRLNDWYCVVKTNDLAVVFGQLSQMADSPIKIRNKPVHRDCCPGCHWKNL